MDRLVKFPHWVGFHMETIISQAQQTSWVEWFGTAAGLIGVYWSIKERVLAWPFFILCYSSYVYLSLSASLYAAMGLNACFIPISFYGWWRWSRSTGSGSAGKAEGGRLAIARLGPKGYGLALGALLAGSLLIGWALDRFTEGYLPYLDAFASTLSLIAQWMLGRKLIENWIAWFVADLVFVFLWGVQGYWVAVFMFVVFMGLAVMGFAQWRKELRSHEG